MSKHYSSDNECILTGGLWALIAALVVGLVSWIFFDFWPTTIVISVVALLIGLLAAFFMCKTRTVGRGGVDLRAVDLARAEMGSAAAPTVEAVDDGKAEAEAAAKAKAKAKADVEAAKAKTAKAEEEAKADAVSDVSAHEDEAKPELLAKARGGKADDLKKLKGVGPKLEKELNQAGVFHFDQIASWSKEQVVWADQHLVSFKGRVSRDSWVAQAKELLK